MGRCFSIKVLTIVYGGEERGSLKGHLVPILKRTDFYPFPGGNLFSLSYLNLGRNICLLQDDDNW